MKGNQGLELLASMSGDASKVEESRASAPAAGTPAPSAASSTAAPSASEALAAALGTNSNAIAAALTQHNNANLIQAAAGLLLQQQNQPAPLQQQVQDSASAAVQHLAQLHLLQAQAKAQAAQQAQAQAAAAAATNPAALALAVAAQQQLAQQQKQQVTSPRTTKSTVTAIAPTTSTTSSSKPSPIPIAAAPPKELQRLPIAKRPISLVAPATVSVSSGSVSAAASLSGTDALSISLDEKKVQKRAANRRSAQLSRKRKKQFIEDLREENAILRRKEQILRAIPDLVVVFDSAGRLLFVSQSVERLLDFSPDELDGSSFWDRLCDESVRLLKAAFMDALAARSSGTASSNSSVASGKTSKSRDEEGPESESVPLGSGMWELRLVDRDGTQHLVTLSGVVHFLADESGHSSPECVCSIRPRETARNHLRPPTFAGPPQSKRARMSTDGDANMVDPSSSSSSSEDNDGSSNAPSTTSEGGGSSNTESDGHFPPNLVRDAIKPQQSVISNASCGSTSALSSDGDGTKSVFADAKRKKADGSSKTESVSGDYDDSVISESSSVRVAG